MPSTRSRTASMHLTYRGGPCLEIGGQGSSQSDKTTLDRITIQRRPAGTRVEFRDTHKAGCGQADNTSVKGCQGPRIAHKNRPVSSTRECPHCFGRLGPSVSH
ncbi:hypothetical protein K438DRAFT_1926850 [Mycena galopus ATCC 62051]|nr:hypothetical protein K438DRAFT_1926850 [Mycena galopus ATCC 62051]